MISQAVKDAYWFLVSPATALNLRCQTLSERLRARPAPLYLNLGSGHRYIDGLINVELNLFRRKDMWLDIRRGLPFRDDSVAGIYLCHVLEHFSYSDARKILAECHRVLATSGGLRIVVPSLEKAISAFVRNDAEWFLSFPDAYQSIGGKFNNEMLCRDQHRLMFDRSFMEELLVSVGLTIPVVCTTGESNVFPPSLLDRVEPEQDRQYYGRHLVVEAFR